MDKQKCCSLFSPPRYYSFVIRNFVRKQIEAVRGREEEKMKSKVKELVSESGLNETVARAALQQRLDSPIRA